MFIDYLTLLLVNMAAGMFVLACYFLSRDDAAGAKRFAAPFAAVALVALVGGFHMVFHWPLPGAYNLIFGETTVLLGAFFAAAALAVAREWDLTPLGVYSLFAGAAAIVFGARIANLGLTVTPKFTALGFLLSGAAGVLALPAFHCRTQRGLRAVTAVILIAASLMWAFVGGMGIWGHLGADNFKHWKPPTMQAPPQTK